MGGAGAGARTGEVMQPARSATRLALATERIIALPITDFPDDPVTAMVAKLAVPDSWTIDTDRRRAG
jgi:hypothetical protein